MIPVWRCPEPELEVYEQDAEQRESPEDIERVDPLGRSERGGFPALGIPLPGACG